MKFVFLAVAGVLAVSSALPAQERGTLLVLSKKKHTLSIVDPATLKVTASVPVGDDPHEVIASSDGALAFVSNYGGGTLHSLAVIDLVQHAALAPVDLSPLRGPHGLAFQGGKVWFTAEGSKVIGHYDPASKKVDFILGTGQNRTHMIHVAADGEHILTTNVNSGTVSILDREAVTMPPPPPGAGRSGPSGPPPNMPPPRGPRVDWNQTVVRVGNGSEGFDVSPDGREIWVANAHDGTLSIIDAASKSVVATLSADARDANRLKFTPDGKRVLVSTLGGPDLIVLDAHTRQVIKRLPVGHGAAGIQMEPGGSRAFVACSPDDYVAVIDLASLTVSSRIDAGPEPDGMAWAPSPK